MERRGGLIIKSVLLGVVLLVVTSALQKSLIDAPVFTPKGYLVPVGMGALYGLVIGVLRKRERAYQEDLEERVAERTRTIEEQKEVLEKALEDLRGYQEQAFIHRKRQAFTKFIQGIHHGFNTPLGNMVTYSSFLTHQLRALQESCGKKDQETVEEIATDLLESASLLDKNVQNLVRLIQEVEVAENLYDEHALSYFSPKAVIERVVGQYQGRKKEIELTLGCQGCEDFVLSYEEALAHMVDQLVDNAYCHGHAQGQKGQVEVLAQLKDSQLVIEVADDGKGLDPALFEQVYDPFFTTNRSTSNVGLGLYQVLNMAEGLFGGSVEMEERNPGLLVRLTLNVEDRDQIS